tara:strand:- start:185 stop:373 length:189 start_codon:yes stop_codon:yes gene_type:complete
MNKEYKMSIIEKKDKVGFILCCRAEEEKALQQNETFYQLIFNELMNTDDYEVNIEFNFYYNK